jgi:signal transduction histidine kinase
MLCLRVIEGPDAGGLLPLPPGEPQLLGRSSEALPLSDRGVSRRHAELTPDGDAWFVRDLDSASGTRLNGAVLTDRRELHVDDDIRCGHTRLVVTSIDSPIAGPSRRTVTTSSTTFEQPSPVDAPKVLEALVVALGKAIDGDTDAAATANLPGDLAAALGELATSRSGLERRVHLAAMGEGVASVSHAIKNILQGLQGGAGAVSLALERDDLPMAKEAWPIMARNLDRISDLALNMLAFSRPRVAHRRLHSIAAIVNEVLLLLETPFAHRHVTLHSALECDLPPIPLDAAAIHQALLNLLLNALQAVEPRSGHVEVHAGLEASHAWIEVVDNGPGVPMAQRDKIFEPFASTRGQRGTGLGLAVTKQIALQHGGELIVDDAALGGARFKLTLSLDLPSQDADETDVPDGRPPTPDVRFD